MRILRRFAPLAAVVAILGCRQPATSDPIPTGVRYLSRAAWGANAPVLAMRPHALRRLTIHHTGVAQAPARSAVDKVRALQQFSQRDDSLADGRRKPAWADIPYHYYVAVDGTVLEAREAGYVGDSNTPYDPTGHLLVVVEGNFQTDSLSTAQRHALFALVPSLARHHGIPADSLAGHRDFASTSCPGSRLYAELPRLRERVRAAGVTARRE